MKAGELRIFFIDNNVFSNSKEAINLNKKSNFGEVKGGKVIYSIFEALYLVENKKAEIFIKSKKIDFDLLMRYGKRIDKRVNLKYIVFKDLRNKGYILKTALKFGADFRVYSKGIRPGKGHAKWLLFIDKEGSKLSWHDFSAKNRVAHSTKKNLLIGVVDDEEDVLYYEVKWVKT